MLAVKTYDQDYIDECRSQVEAQLAAYRKLVSSVGTAKASTARLQWKPLRRSSIT
jgi:hypothetical protein